MTSYLAKIGTSDPVEPFASMKALVESFDIGKFGRAPAHYDVAELERLNEKLLAHMPFAIAKPALDAQGLGAIDEYFWHSVRGNIKRLRDAKDWWDMVQGGIAPVVEDKDFAAKAAELLPPEPWTAESWSGWTKAIGQATGRKGKELFMPIRKALTGREDGPEMKVLFALLGREKVLKRLTGGAA